MKQHLKQVQVNKITIMSSESAELLQHMIKLVEAPLFIKTRNLSKIEDEFRNNKIMENVIKF